MRKDEEGGHSRSMSLCPCPLPCPPPVCRVLEDDPDFILDIDQYCPKALLGLVHMLETWTSVGRGLPDLQDGQSNSDSAGILSRLRPL